MWSGMVHACACLGLPLMSYSHGKAPKIHLYIIEKNRYIAARDGAQDSGNS